MGDIGISFGTRISNVNIYGISSLLLAWLAYASTNPIIYNKNVDPFYIWGFIPTPWFLAPLITIISYQMLAPPNNSLSNLLGIDYYY